MGKILAHYSKPRNNLFAPEWLYIFYEAELNDKKLIDDIKDIILTKEKQIIKQFPELNNDGGTGLGSNSLTSKFLGFNVFSWTEEPILKFQEFVREEYRSFISELHKHYYFEDESKTYVGCWANVLRKNQSMMRHWHSCTPNSYLGAHFCVQTDDTSTIYENPFNNNDKLEFKNIPGKLLFFQNYMPHYTTVTHSDRERITIAMDIITQKEKESTDPEDIHYTKHHVEFV